MEPNEDSLSVNQHRDGRWSENGSGCGHSKFRSRVGTNSNRHRGDVSKHCHETNRSQKIRGVN